LTLVAAIHEIAATMSIPNRPSLSRGIAAVAALLATACNAGSELASVSAGVSNADGAPETLEAHADARKFRSEASSIVGENPALSASLSAERGTFAITTHGLKVKLSTHALMRGAQRMSLEAAPFALGACASDGSIASDKACLQRAESHRPHLVEWWENRARGVEHGFDLARKPLQSANGPLLVTVDVAGAAVSVDGGGQFATLTLDEETTLFYSGLVAIDADGKHLPSKLVSARDGLAIEIDDSTARYPLTIDPAVTFAPWNVEIDIANAQLGAQVASAGDVNGDGYGDVIVGAPGYVSGSVVGGRVFVYHGTASGLSTTPAFQLSGSVANARFGASVAGAGDLDGDGFDDVIIGAPNYSNGQINEGQFCIVLGGTATGLRLNTLKCVESNAAQALLGTAVAGVGDLNGDMRADVAIGAPGFTNGQAAEGVLYSYFGVAGTGIGNAPSWTEEGDLADARLGLSVSGGGDVDGNTVGEILAGGNGIARLYLAFNATPLPVDPVFSIGTVGAANQLGASVAGLGDTNGDTWGDIIIGAPGGEGTALLYRGTFLGIRNALNIVPVTITLDMARGATLDQPFARFGASVSSAGDINYDGYNDIIIGAPGAHLANGLSAEGVAFTLAGRLGAATVLPAAVSILTGGQTNAMSASSVACAGDVNGDGLSDIVIGTPAYSNGQSGEGAVSVSYASFNGGAGPSTTPTTTILNNNATTQYGDAAAHVGDINGDGLGDIIVGDPGYSNGQTREGAVYVHLGGTVRAVTLEAPIESNVANMGLGMTIAPAGDVNADGYADVLISSLNGRAAEQNQRAVFLYLGSATGLSPTPFWSTQGAANTYLGHSMAGLADIDGDGYGDFAIGEPTYGSGETYEGHVLVVFGSSGQPTRIVSMEPNVVNAYLGSAVAFGDVNKDGYSDLIVGAGGWTRAGMVGHGRAFVYAGSAAGLANTPMWTGAPTLPTAAQYGMFVASGDVTGDGRDDVLIGAPYYSGSSSPDLANKEAGAVFLYVAASNGTIPSAATRLISTNDAYAHYGPISVGDYTGDGFADMAVGAPGIRSLNPAGQVGAVYLYLGNSTGIPPFGGDLPAWSSIGTRANYALGNRVDLAGDANGDGYADLLATAPFRGAFLETTSVGRVYSYISHSSIGIPIGPTPQLRRPGSTAPIVAPGRGYAVSSTSFPEILLRNVRPPARNGWVRVRAETAPIQSGPFNGAYQTFSPFTKFAGTNSGSLKTMLSGAGIGLNGAPAFAKARTRIEYHRGTTLAWWRQGRWLPLGVPSHPEGRAFYAW